MNIETVVSVSNKDLKDSAKDKQVGDVSFFDFTVPIELFEKADRVIYEGDNFRKIIKDRRNSVGVIFRS
jgi:hypothetical protein